MKLRLLSMPRDYTYAEARALLKQLGFIESNKGRTSGSRVRFYRASDGKIILMHKPHADNAMSAGCVRDLAKFLSDLGELNTDGE